MIRLDFYILHGGMKTGFGCGNCQNQAHLHVRLDAGFHRA
jgi:hypothetical protein